MILTNSKLGISAQCSVLPLKSLSNQKSSQLLSICSQVHIHIKAISCVQHPSHSLDYGSVDQLLPPLDDRLLVGQVAKKGSTKQQVWISAPGWKPGTYRIQIAPQTALELVKYEHIMCQLFAPDGSSLEV